MPILRRLPIPLRGYGIVPPSKTQCFFYPTRPSSFDLPSPPAALLNISTAIQHPPAHNLQPLVLKYDFFWLTNFNGFLSPRNASDQFLDAQYIVVDPVFRGRLGNGLPFPPLLGSVKVKCKFLVQASFFREALSTLLWNGMSPHLLPGRFWIQLFSHSRFFPTEAVPPYLWLVWTLT